jgi:hypothetical protein
MKQFYPTMSFEESFDFVQSKHENINPNSGFIQCLKDYEKFLNKRE